MSMGRPDILFPLFAGLETLAGVGPKTAKALPAMGIERPRDLLFTLPHTVVDRRRRDSLREVAPGEVATVEVTVLRHQPPIRKGLPYRVIVEDAELAFQVVFFAARRNGSRRNCRLANAGFCLARLNFTTISIKCRIPITFWSRMRRGSWGSLNPSIR